MKNLFTTRHSARAIDLSLLILRIGLGALMIPHGYKKLMNFGAKSSGFADPFGIGSPLSMGLVIFAELFCASLIIIGLMTRAACIPLIIAMSVALIYSHNGKLFTEGELATLYLTGFIALLIAGPGKISMDRVLWR